jgi:hypothetical protein
VPSLIFSPGTSSIALSVVCERTIESLAPIRGGGMILPPDTTTVVNRDLIIALAARHQLPAIYSLRIFVTGGGLISYASRIQMLDLIH